MPVGGTGVLCGGPGKVCPPSLSPGLSVWDLGGPPTESQEPWFRSLSTFTETMKDRRLGLGDLPEVCLFIGCVTLGSSASVLSFLSQGGDVPPPLRPRPTLC